MCVSLDTYNSSISYNQYEDKSSEYGTGKHMCYESMEG